MAEICPICDTTMTTGESGCPSCGAPADVEARAERGQRAECPACGSVIWSHVETCPACRARGYPALRPRFGDKALRAPETEAAEETAEGGEGGADGSSADGETEER